MMRLSRGLHAALSANYDDYTVRHDGALPVLLAGGGAGLRQPMGVAVVGELVFSQLQLPCLLPQYCIFSLRNYAEKVRP